MGTRRRWAGTTEEVSSSFHDDEFMEHIESAAFYRQPLDDMNETDWEAMGGSLPEGLDESDGGQFEQQDWEGMSPSLDDIISEHGPMDRSQASKDVSNFDKEFLARNNATINGVAVRSATQLLGRPKIKMPWETSVLAPIFGGDFSFKPKVESVFNMSLVGAIEAMTPVVSSSSTSEPVAPSAHVQARRRLHISRLVQSEDDTRAAALKKLRVMVLVNPNSTMLGRTLLSLAGTLH